MPLQLLAGLLGAEVPVGSLNWPAQGWHSIAELSLSPSGAPTQPHWPATHTGGPGSHWRCLEVKGGRRAGVSLGVCTPCYPTPSFLWALESSGSLSGNEAALQSGTIPPRLWWWAWGQAPDLGLRLVSRWLLTITTATHPIPGMLVASGHRRGN